MLVRPLLISVAIAALCWLDPSCVAAGLCIPIAFLFPSCTCCGANCTTASDTFTGGTITGWTQVSGSWSQSGTLTTSSTGAIIINNTASGPTGGGASVVIPGSAGTTRTLLRIIGAYDSGTGNCLYGEVDIESGADITISLYSKTSGSSTLISSRETTLDGSNDLTLSLCWNASVTALTLTDSSHDSGSVEGSHSQTGSQVGLGTGSTATNILFDTFSFSCTDCPALTACSSYCSPSARENYLIILPGNATSQVCDFGFGNPAKAIPECESKISGTHVVAVYFVPGGVTDILDSDWVGRCSWRTVERYSASDAQVCCGHPPFVEFIYDLALQQSVSTPANLRFTLSITLSIANAGPCITVGAKNSEVSEAYYTSSAFSASDCNSAHTLNWRTDYLGGNPAFNPVCYNYPATLTVQPP